MAKKESSEYEKGYEEAEDSIQSCIMNNGLKSCFKEVKRNIEMLGTTLNNDFDKGAFDCCIDFLLRHKKTPDNYAD